MTDPRISIGPDVVGTEGDQVVDALDQFRPIVRIDPNLPPPAAAAAAALTAILIRVFPHTTVDGDASLEINPWNAMTVSDALARSATELRPTRDHARDVTIAVGSVPGTANLYIGGDDWTAAISTNSPVAVSACSSALGVHAAASLAAAELSKHALAPLGMTVVRLPADFVWNLMNHRLEPAPDFDRPRHRQPARVGFFGCGSVGSSSAAVLTCIDGLIGHAWTVDMDTIDPDRNPYRYPALAAGSSGDKAIWVGEMLRRAGWTAQAHVGDVSSWVRSQPSPGLHGIAVSSVDTVDGRRDVADILAQTTLSAGVSGLALHLQVEHPADAFACPYCDFVDARSTLELSGVHAALVGLEEPRIIELSAAGATLSRMDLNRSVAAGRVHPGRVTDLVGRRLDDLIRVAYAEATVPLPDGSKPAAVTAPYVSWMNGVLVCAEIDKDALGLPLLHRRVDLDLSGVPLGVSSTRPRDASGRCTCHSAVRVDWVTRLYP